MLTLKRLALGTIVAAPMLFNAVALWPEVASPAPNVNDDAEHVAFTQRADEALSGGENVIDHWLPNIDLGFPEFFYYQHVPHLAVVALDRVLLRSVDLLTVFNFVRWTLLVTFPLTVFWSMRRMGFAPGAAAVSAASSALLSGDHRYGFEYDSYVWRGFGLYTQIWAMHLTFIGIANLYRLLTRGTGHISTILTLALLALSHLIYAYMMAISAVVLVLFSIRRGSRTAILTRLAIVGASVLAISSYMWVPFITETAYLSTSPFLQPEKFNSYGASVVLGWFASGELLDHGRLPIFTAMTFVGVAAAVVTKRRIALLAVALLVLWLWFYSGRAAIGPLFAILPLHDGLLFHRFIGGVDLAAILLIGVGADAIWTLLQRLTARLPVRAPYAAVGIAAVALGIGLAPALSERWAYYAAQSTWLAQTRDAIAADRDLKTVLDILRREPPGRVYAGLASNWGRTLDFGLPFNSVHVYQLLTSEGFATVAPPFGGMSLNSDLQFDFDDQRAAQYDLYNVRYVIARPTVSLPLFLTKLAVTPGYVLYEAPTSGYAEFVSLAGAETFHSQATLFPSMRAFVNGTGPEARTYLRFDFPAASTVGAGSMAGCSDAGRIANETVEPSRLSFDMSCPTATPTILKISYHPGWAVSVDGISVPTFMASPSYVGFTLPAGTHHVVAEYRSAPIKTPLLGLGALTVGALAVFGTRGTWLRRLGPGRRSRAR